MEKPDSHIKETKYFPQTYLIIPFYIGENERDKEFFLKYIRKCENDKNKQWKLRHLAAKTQSTFRNTEYFDYVQQFFTAFKGDSNSYNDECIVMELKDGTKFSKYDPQYKQYNDTPHVYKSEFLSNMNEQYEFSIQCHRNSIDSIRLVMNVSAKTCLLVVPIRPYEISLDKYQVFLHCIRASSIECIYAKGSNETPWSLNRLFDDLMADFKGYYTRVNCDYVQHLTLILVDNNIVGEQFCEILLGITCGKSQIEMANLKSFQTLRLTDNVLIGASHEGTTIMSALKISKDKNEKIKQKQYYALEQRERIVLFFAIVLQRFILLHVIFDLTKNRKTFHRFSIVNWIRSIGKSKRELKDLRYELGVVCRTKVKNSFTSISDVPEINGFYRLCSNALEIEALYCEIDNKIKVLDSYLTQKTDESKERADWHLSIILAILTVMSASNDGINIIDRINDHGDYKWLYYAGLIFAIIFVAYLFVTIIRTRR